MENIPLSRPYASPESVNNIQALITGSEYVGDLLYTKRCKEWFEKSFKGYQAYLTTTCTHAIEMAAQALDFCKGDEVILPSYNYVGVANAFLNAGASLVFVDIDPLNMNIDADKIEEAISPRTRVVSIMHYAGISCEIKRIRKICNERNIILFEDNAHGIGVEGPDGNLGSFGQMSCISFDRLKNVSIHQGGVLLCRESYVNAVDVAFNNGTNRQAFFNGKVSSYSWVGRGSNYALSEYLAAALLPLLNDSDKINAGRRKRWDMYYERIFTISALTEYLPHGLESYPHNGHIFYLKAKNKEERDTILAKLKSKGIQSSFHYVPLHNSEAGKRYSRFHGKDIYTTRESERLFRLPLHNYLEEDEINYIVDTLQTIIQ